MKVSGEEARLLLEALREWLEDDGVDDEARAIGEGLETKLLQAAQAQGA